MNPGAVEEGSKLANTVVAALGSQPMTLAMIVSNIVLLLYLFYSGVTMNRDRTEMAKLVIQEHIRTSEMLAKCVVPPQ